MPLRLSTATQNAKANAAVDLIDVGATNPAGKIRVYTGTQPATANLAPTGTLLAEFDMANPAYGAAVAGVAALDATPVLATTGVAAGTAGWCRVLDRNLGTVFDGHVTATGGGGVLELNTTTVSVGVNLEITGGTYTQPAG